MGIRLEETNMTGKKQRKKTQGGKMSPRIRREGYLDNQCVGERC